MLDFRYGPCYNLYKWRKINDLKEEQLKVKEDKEWGEKYFNDGVKVK